MNKWVVGSIVCVIAVWLWLAAMVGMVILALLYISPYGYG